VRFVINDEDLFVSHNAGIEALLNRARLLGRRAFVESHPCIVAAVIIVQIVDKGPLHPISERDPDNADAAREGRTPFLNHHTHSPLREVAVDDLIPYS